MTTQIKFAERGLIIPNLRESRSLDSEKKHRTEGRTYTRHPD